MANLINEDYFIRDINIPSNDTSAVAMINSEIEKYQELVLIQVLGYDLYSKFIADPDSEQRFKDIRDGAEFEFNFCGKTVKRKYVGLVNAKKESLIAYFTYFYLISNKVTFTSSTGEVIADNENSKPASSNQKLVRAWNNFIEMSGDITNKDYYYILGYFDKLNLSSYVHVNDAPSLYNFLLANKEVYPEWEFTPSEKINIFGI